MIDGGGASRRVIALAAMSVALATCSAACSAAPGDGACAAVEPAPATEAALLPAGLSFDRIGTVTRVVRTDGHLTVHALSAAPIDELTVLIQDAVTAAGYRPAGMDNEGFEAEVFFTSGSYAAGQALVRRAGCEGWWDIDLVLVDSAAAPSQQRPPTSTGMPTSTF